MANTHVIMESRNNPELGKALEQADLVIADGMPLVMAGRLRGFPEATRADGPTLLQKALELDGLRHYFLGSTPEVIEALTVEIKRNHPAAVIAGSYSPPFRALSDSENTEIINHINESRPDILWVGLGCPKQEIWMEQNRKKLQVPAMAGVGMAFDILAGNKPRAPQWMQKSGLEWLFRLYCEPGRLWKRYIVYNTQFIFLFGLEQLQYSLGKPLNNPH